MAKAPKAEQTEMGIEGPGVSPVKDKKLDNLGRKFRDLREESASIGEQKTKNESEILERMKELGIKVYKLDDQLLTVKPAKRHVALKTIKAEGADDPWDEAGEKAPEASEGGAE